MLTSPQLRNRPPQSEHWFGTDAHRSRPVRAGAGRRADARSLVGVVATLVSVVVGVSYGAVAGFCGGKLDEVMMRFVDFCTASPTCSW